MAISGKSMAALLLMVATVLAGAANAQVNVTSSLCNQTVELRTGVANLTIAPGNTVVFNGTLPDLLQAAPVIVAILSGLPVPDVIPIDPALIATLLSTLPVGPIPTLTIECSPENCITIRVSANIPILGGLITVPVSGSIGEVCPPLP